MRAGLAREAAGLGAAPRGRRRTSAVSSTSPASQEARAPERNRLAAHSGKNAASSDGMAPARLPKLQQHEGQRAGDEAGEPARVAEGRLEPPVLARRRRAGTGCSVRARRPPSRSSSPSITAKIAAQAMPRRSLRKSDWASAWMRQERCEEQVEPQPVDGADRIERVLRESPQHGPEDVTALEKSAVLQHDRWKQHQRERGDERVQGEEREDRVRFPARGAPPGCARAATAGSRRAPRPASSKAWLWGLYEWKP